MPITFGMSGIDLVQLFYVSTARVAYEPASVTPILSSSRLNNRRLDITGCLMYSGRFFAQLLEGPSSTVLPLYERISRDAGHSRMKLMELAASRERRFPGCSMGYLYDVYLEDDLIDLAWGVGEPCPRRVAAIASSLRPDCTTDPLL